MADKSVGELIAAQSVTPTDLFVLEQNGTAKKLTGQVLENWLVSFADGHGGIHSIEKLSTSGLADTYRITMADTTTFDFVVTNGRSITDISKTSTSGLVDTYTISYNNGTTSKFTVTNGEKGDKGNNAYIWIKYASQEPTESSHSIGDIPDDWIGIYSGKASAAPTDWKQYQWFKHKGEQGDTGAAATLLTRSVTYQVGDSGTIIPSGSWGSSIPVVSQGKYMWTKTELRFNTGDPIVSYSVARMGIDGSGSVSSVCNVSPDSDGNVALTAANVGAMPTTGGDFTGPVRMNGQTLSGLSAPTEDTEAATKGYTLGLVKKAAPRNLLDNSDFTNPVNQRGVSGTISTSGYFLDRWKLVSGTVTINDGSITLNGTMMQILEFAAGTAIAACDGGAVATYDDSSRTLTVTGSNATITWVALYEGEYTTETLPEYQPKGFAAELTECRRYYRQTMFLNCVQTSGQYFSVSKTIEMRVVPTVTLISFSPYGTENITDFTSCELVIMRTAPGVQLIGYAKLPTCTEHKAGGLMVNLSAEL